MNSLRKENKSLRMSKLWGFDPLELLRRTEFPNDENEYKIRHSRSFRLVRYKFQR